MCCSCCGQWRIGVGALIRHALKCLYEYKQVNNTLLTYISKVLFTYISNRGANYEIGSYSQPKRRSRKDHNYY